MLVPVSASNAGTVPDPKTNGRINFLVPSSQAQTYTNISRYIQHCIHSSLFSDAAALYRGNNTLGKMAAYV